jgi:hypothetical protein
LGILTKINIPLKTPQKVLGLEKQWRTAVSSNHERLILIYLNLKFRVFHYGVYHSSE